MSTTHQANFKWIDFVRGVSCLGIVLYHVRIDLWVGWTEITKNPDIYSGFDRLAALLSIPIPFLRPTVMMFFLISGFCIHFPYALGNRPFNLKAFLSRRIFRIYPPYFFAILFGALIQWLCSDYFAEQLTTSASLNKIFKSIFMIQNWGIDSSQMAANPALWFIPVQIELYLMYPIFLWLTLKYGLKHTLMGVTAVSFSSLAMLIWQASDNPDRYLGNVHHFPVYWIIWCAGALLAEWVKRGNLPRWNLKLGGLAVALCAIALGTTLTKQYIGLQEMVWSGVYFLILLWGLTSSSVLQQVPSFVLKSSLFLSTISYSLYLTHFPLFKLLGSVWLSHFETKPANFLIPIVFSGLAVLFAYGFYKAVEKPTHQAAAWLSHQLTLSKDFN